MTNPKAPTFEPKSSAQFIPMTLAVMFMVQCAAVTFQWSRGRKKNIVKTALVQMQFFIHLTDLWSKKGSFITLAREPF